MVIGMNKPEYLWAIRDLLPSPDKIPDTQISTVMVSGHISSLYSRMHSHVTQKIVTEITLLCLISFIQTKRTLY